jgi:hypothetical protein
LFEHKAMPPSIDARQGKAKARDGLDIASLPKEVQSLVFVCVQKLIFIWAARAYN